MSDLCNAGELTLRIGEMVVVDTSKGPGLAEIAGLVRRRVMEKGRVRRIIRRASDEDVVRHEQNKETANAAFKYGLQRIRARKLRMKLCQVEYMLDGSRVLFYFSAEQRIDFRQLVRDLARHLNARIEMRQVGVREGAGLIGGIGPCGKELCCSSFLRSFQSISIRHAKEQGLTLNPKKVSGMCGRLMCCLVYEYPTYRLMKKGAPRVNRAVDTAKGPGVVSDVDLLQRVVRVYLEAGGRETFKFSEIIVDDATVRRARDVRDAAPRSRPKRETRVTRAGSNLQETYQWDGAEAETTSVLDATTAGEATAPAHTKRRRRRRRPGSKPPQGERAQGASRQRSLSPSQSGPEASGEDRPKRRKRRRRRRRSSGSDGSGGGGTGGTGGSGGEQSGNH
jgi:cell fate regulator YaaT (PSP1 superfamily)